MEVSVHHFDLPLQHEFRISREAHSVQPTCIVELTQDGRHGFGEATTNTYYGVTRATLTASIESQRAFLKSARWSTPSDLWQQLAERLPHDPFALCALDEACHDLWGKLQGKPVHELWQLDTRHTPASNYTIGLDRVDVMIRKLREMPDWPIYKIKLGTPDDLEIVKALRQETDAVFRVDANCGWDLERTLQAAPQLKALGVEFIEQPLPADRWDDYARLVKDSALPIVADESCQVESDVARCGQHFHGINIKLVKCGGLTPARRMIDHARQLGLKVMVGCMTESTVGISAIAQLLPLLDYVDMDGAVLLAHDVATGVRVERGRCVYPDAPGHGVTLVGLEG